ncbi:MAG: LysM peptidoglycan-binding domain-containing protein [Gaiellaceae bacterium]
MFPRLLTIVLAATFGWAVFAHTSNGAGRPVHYVVKPGETLWSIAQNRYGGDPREGIWKLEHANGLVDATIVPGERLLLP